MGYGGLRRHSYSALCIVEVAGSHMELYLRVLIKDYHEGNVVDIYRDN